MQGPTEKLSVKRRGAARALRLPASEDGRTMRLKQHQRPARVAALPNALVEGCLHESCFGLVGGGGLSTRRFSLKGMVGSNMRRLQRPLKSMRSLENGHSSALSAPET